MTGTITLLAFIGLASLVVSQGPTQNGPQTLLEILTPDFIAMNEAAVALFPIFTFFYQTPLVIRSVFLYSVSSYEIAAACHPQALSFFGTRDKIDTKLCTPLARIKICSYIINRMYEQEFPEQASSFSAFLKKNGLTPDDRSTDITTDIGWANFIANRANEYLRNDGWNSVGDLSRQKFRQPYSDYTRYKPVNLAGQLVSKLRSPLRWQPLVQSTGSVGDFASQVHVVPQLPFAKPLVLTGAEIDMRKAKGPYSEPNRRRTVSNADKRLLDALIRKFFRISRNLTVKQRFQAFFWESKILSLGSFIPFYDELLKPDSFDVATWFLGEMLAQHDALLVAWKEKRRHDLVRPTTIIRKLWKGRTVRAFVGANDGVQRVRAEEYEPMIPIQPHSEFPSASAILCEASLEHLQFAITRTFGNNFTIPKYVLPVSPTAFAFLPLKIPESFDLVYNTLEEAALKCGRARLWAGVHFEPSVKEGNRIGKGIGAKASEHAAALAEGRVPRNCARCQ